MSEFNRELELRELERKFKLSLKMHWFLPLLLCALLFTGFNQQQWDFFVPLLKLVGAIYAGNLLAALILRRPTAALIRSALIVQFTIDLAATTSLVESYAVADSAFTVLYPVIIVTAGLFLPGQGALIVATIAAALYTGTMVYTYYYPEGTAGGYFGDLIGQHQLLNREDYLIVVATIKILFFYVVAFLTVAMRRIIDSTRRELDRARLDNETLIVTMPAGLIAVGCDEQVARINERAATLLTRFGLTVTEGARFAEVLPAKFAELLQRAVDSEMTCHSRIVHRHGDSEYHCDAQAAPLLRDGVHYGGVLIFVDVTAQVELERQLERSQRMSLIGKMLASIAYGVRNPVQSALRYAEVMNERLQKSKVQFGEMMMLTGALRRADTALTRIQDFTQLSASRSEAVNLLTLLGRVRMARFEELKHKRVQWLVEGENVTAQGDAARLEQLINNLVDNSLAAMPDGGTLTLHLAYEPRSDAPDKWVSLRCGDTGTGIDADLQGRIFDPFFTTKGEGHYGLGLSACAKTADDLGGSLLL
ncbi:MAG TPA: ATP-binding protein, partial [bacterium]|nr:ATP-binding protein [bacterium]